MGQRDPRAHPSQQNAEPDAMKKPTQGSRDHKGKMSAAKDTLGDHRNNTIVYPLRDRQPMYITHMSSDRRKLGQPSNKTGS